MRVSSGNVRKRKHKKILEATKGFRMTKSKLYRVAHEAFMHAGQYSLAHRRQRLGQMRNLWIKRLNAAAVSNGLKYNELISKMKKSEVKLNRKVLAEVAYRFPETFSKFVKSF